MLNINTRIFDSSDMRLAKSAKIIAEGQALVYVPGEGGLAPSKGESGEIFAGFVMRRTSAAPVVEAIVAGKPYIIEAAKAKYVAAKAIWDATSNCVQIHGGTGYSREYPIERYYRESKALFNNTDYFDYAEAKIAKEMLK